MEKKLVNLEIPSLGENYDMFIPEYMYVGDLLKLLIQAVKDLTENRYVSSGGELLCIRESGSILRSDEQLSSYRLRNGDHLVLY